MTKLSLVRLREAIDFAGQSSVVEFTTDMGVTIETDGAVLRIEKNGEVHLLPFTNVRDSREVPAQQAFSRAAALANVPSIDSKLSPSSRPRK